MVIGIYPRKSVYRDNSDSVQVQVKMCKDYAGIVFRGQPLEFKIYDKDEGFSGKNTNRPSFQSMMADVKANLLDAVVVYKLDRISRNVREFSAMYEIFQQHNVAFISVKESFDTSTPMGRTVMYILAAFAQLERENTSERVTDGMLSLGSSGKWTGGNCPLGMTSIRKKIGDKEHSYLVVDPETITNVQLFYQLMLQGYSITKLERYCRDQGIRSRTGKFLSTSQLYNILTNPVYCQNSPEAYAYFASQSCSLPPESHFDGKHGLIAYGRTKTAETSQKRQDMTSWSISIGIHEPVLSFEDWFAVQKRMGVNKMYRSAKYEIGILKGVLRCSCGSRMDIRTYMKNGIIFSYYYCAAMARQGKEHCNSGFTRVDQVDESFLKQLRCMRLNPDNICLRKETPFPQQDTAALQTELKDIQKSLDNLTDSLMQAMESPAAAYIIAKIEKLDKQKTALENKLRQSKKKDLEEKSLEEKKKIIHENICYLLDNFENISYTGKNETIKKIVKSCVFDGKSLRIIL